MIKTNTADLIGPALDWAVAQAEGVETSWRYGRELVKVHDNGGIRLIESIRSIYSPSTDWSQGGVLIDKFGLAFMENSWPDTDDSWIAVDHGRESCGQGATHLIAACRAIVAAKLGDTVQVPAELVEVAQ